LKIRTHFDEEGARAAFWRRRKQANSGNTGFTGTAKIPLSILHMLEAADQQGFKLRPDATECDDAHYRSH